MPDYQFPGRLELTNINDAFGKTSKHSIPQKSALQKVGQQTIEGSKLYNASRKGSDQAAQEVAALPDNPKDSVSFKASERSLAKASSEVAKSKTGGASNGQMSAAQKMDQFIKN
mmetsp:Transcript_12705/g.21402  ORF Transcript_12705/g.21402 Transcript_12705/m.21402 type:complete len:114 (+) Transcript_12705:985-1326(+)